MSEYVFKTDEPIKGCAKCPMRHRQGSAWCQYLMKWTPTNEETERREDCHLVELLPHGNLKDTDFIIEKLTDKIYDSNIYRVESSELIEQMIEIIKNAPTILEATE